MKKSLSALLASLVLFAGSMATAPQALAQTAAPAASEASLSENHLAIARDVVVLSGMSRTFDGMVPTLAEQVRQTYITRPEISADLNVVLEQIKPELERRKEELMAASARILATRINEQNLTAIRSFFQSPAGQQFVATQPLVLEDLFSAMNSWIGETSEFIVVRVREEMLKKGHQL